MALVVTAAGVVAVAQYAPDATAMFSAQLTGPEKAPMGMNAPVAKHNPQFLLNLMHWLAAVL